MRLGRASAYGMLAMMSIAQTSSSPRNGGKEKTGHHNGNGHARAQASQISHTTGIPVEYLRKVLQRLTRARLVQSERGRSGGFRLAKPASKITLLQIVEAIEGPVDDAAFLSNALSRRAHPRLREWRRHTAEGVRELLDAQSLSDLLD